MTDVFKCRFYRLCFLLWTLIADEVTFASSSTVTGEVFDTVNKRFLLDGLQSPSTLCCDCDDRGGDNPCTTRCEANFNHCNYPEICQTSTFFDGVTLKKRKRCIDSHQCLIDRNSTLQKPGCFKDGGDTGSVCNYCCISTSPFDRGCISGVDGGSLDNIDNFLTTIKAPETTTTTTTTPAPTPTPTTTTTTTTTTTPTTTTTTTTTTTPTPTTTTTTTTTPASTTRPFLIPTKPPKTTPSTTTTTPPMTTTTSTTAAATTTTMLKPPVCVQCNGDDCVKGSDVSKSTHVVQCDERENYCLTVLQVLQDGNYEIAKKGCISKLECSFDHSSPDCVPNMSSTTPFVPGNPRTCQHCCEALNSTDPCNTDITNETIATFDAHTTEDTTTVSSRPTTTMSNASKTSTTTSSTTSLSRSASSSQTSTSPQSVSGPSTTQMSTLTVLKDPTACAVCAGPLELCETIYKTEQCDPPNNYCINILKNHMDGSKTINRTCADIAYCHREWFVGSSDNDLCTTYDSSKFVHLDFSCTYCCIQDNCNVPIRPDDSTLYNDVESLI